MSVNGINNTGINPHYMTGKKRVLGNNFNNQIEDINRGSKVNEPLMSFSNPKTGEGVEIHRSDIYSDDTPIYILKGKTAEGEEFERMHHAWIIDPRNCSYAELMMLNQEMGNTSLGDKQRADILFEKTGVKTYLDKADYCTAIKDVMEEYKSSGNWDAYLSMDKWQQSLNDYTSVPVYFNRSIMGQNIMERNGVKGKSERIPEQEVSAVVASDALMDAFELAKYQKKLERRHIIAIIVLVAIIPMVIFLIDNMTIYGFLGVCVPVTCLLLGVGLLIYGIWRKITKKTCWQTFTIALLMFAVPVILIILLFVVGALGIGPVPN